MAIKRPDIYEHNNPNLPIADSDFVRGGSRSAVQTLNDLYALTGKASQLKQHSTQIYVSGENKIYLLKDVNNVGNVSGWEEFNFGVGSNIVYTTGNQTISGVKAFASRPTVNGTGVLLSGEASQVDLSEYAPKLDPTFGGEIFIGEGAGLYFDGDNYITNCPPIYFAEDAAATTRENLGSVSNTGNQTISGVKAFVSRPTVNGTGVLLSGEAAQADLSSTVYNYFTINITLGNNYINLANSTSGITATLPSIASGRNYIVKNLNTGTLTVTGSNFIDGNVNLKLYKNESAHLLGVNNVGFTGWVSLNTNPGIS